MLITDRQLERRERVPNRENLRVRPSQLLARWSVRETIGAASPVACGVGLAAGR